MNKLLKVLEDRKVFSESAIIKRKIKIFLPTSMIFLKMDCRLTFG